MRHPLQIALLCAALLTLGACGSESKQDPAPSNNQSADMGQQPDAQEDSAEPEDMGQQPDAQEDSAEAPDEGVPDVVEPEDMGTDTADVVDPVDQGQPDGAEPEDMEEPDAQGDMVDPPVEPVPESLQVHWINMSPEDRVTFGKTIVIELEDPGVELPASWAQEQFWNRRFPARMFKIESDGERTEVPLIQIWRPFDAKKRFRPQLQIQPLPNGWPKATSMVLEVDLGQEAPLSLPFRTLPLQYDQFVERHITFEARDCPTCWPYPVDAFIYFPPGYVDPENEDFNNPAVHLPDRPGGDAQGGNPNQKYPVVVLMHTAGEYENNRSLANAAGQRVAWGLMEPAIFLLPNGRLEGEDCRREGLDSQRCHTRFVGSWSNNNRLFAYRDWLVDDMQPELARRVRIRGTDDGGEIEDREIFRRSWSLYGLSAGGYGVLANAFGRPDGWYATVSVVPGVVSAYNRFTNWGDGLAQRDEVCPAPGNGTYPLERIGLGYRDLSGVDPETDRRRTVHFRDRYVPDGARNCYQAIPPVEHDLVRFGLCQLDITCLVDPEAPTSVSNMRAVRDEHPYHGNIYFDTAIFDRGGPPGAFIDLDEVMDRAGIPHTFRYEDRGALFHNWLAVSDRGLGFEYIDNGNGLPRLRGNAPGPGVVYPFLSRAMEGVGNPEFNSPVFSEYTSNVLDPDRDGHIYFNDPERPDLADFSDNCPNDFNPYQFDKDGDGIGDVCDDDVDGDGVPNAQDNCNWPDVPQNPYDPNTALIPSNCQGDVDGDGIPDEIDLCPETFDPVQRDTDHDNVGDACDQDDDNDFVPDVRDNCPLDANQEQADTDGNGKGDICDPSCLIWPFGDLDKDGVACSMDCNDGDASIHPDAPEVCGDGIDNNCDGNIDEGC